jgi:hypothetical protein
MKKEMNFEEFLKKYDKLMDAQEKEIHIQGAYVSPDIAKPFIDPLLKNCFKDQNKLLKFLKKSDKIVVKVSNRTAKGYNVYYSGTIENSRGEIQVFQNVDNGYCVNIG